MTVTLSTVPAQPVALRECRLSLAATVGNFVRVWCTDAPPGSKLRAELDATGATQVVVAAGEAGQNIPFTADRGGAYVFRVEEITKGASQFGGVYDTDPNKAPSETLVGAPVIRTLYFASPLTCNLGAGQDTAELLIYVLQDEIIATTASLHGVVSPALRNTKTGLAKVAAESTAVRSAVTALVGTASTILGTTSTWLDSLIDAFNAHRADATVHASPDTDNVVKADFRGATTTEGQKRSVGAIRKALDNHLRNDNPAATTPGTGSAAYHSAADWTSAALPLSASDQLATLVSAADAYRAYDAHRANTAVHAAPDTTHFAAPPSTLLALHVEFLKQLAAQTPMTPPNEHSAKSLLMSGGGFKEA